MNFNIKNNNLKENQYKSKNYITDSLNSTKDKDYYSLYKKYKMKYLSLKESIIGGSMNRDNLVEPKCKICKSENKLVKEGEEWLVSKNMSNFVVLCPFHYEVYKNKYSEYKELFIQAKKDISNHKFNDSILKLEETIRLRHYVGRTFFNSIDRGHAYFSDEFLPSLIDKIKEGINQNWNSEKILQEWEILYQKVAEPDF